MYITVYAVRRLFYTSIFDNMYLLLVLIETFLLSSIHLLVLHLINLRLRFIDKLLPLSIVAFRARHHATPYITENCQLFREFINYFYQFSIYSHHFVCLSITFYSPSCEEKKSCSRCEISREILHGMIFYLYDISHYTVYVCEDTHEIKVLHDLFCD